MSRAKRIRMRKVRRNRRIAAIIAMMCIAFIVSLIFCNLNVTAEKTDAFKYYREIRVERGDTLWSIANDHMSKEYGSINEYIRDIQKINNLGCDLQYGQKIMIPYYSYEVKI